MNLASRNVGGNFYSGPSPLNWNLEANYNPYTRLNSAYNLV